MKTAEAYNDFVRRTNYLLSSDNDVFDVIMNTSSISSKGKRAQYLDVPESAPDVITLPEAGGNRPSPRSLSQPRFSPSPQQKAQFVLRLLFCPALFPKHYYRRPEKLQTPKKLLRGKSHLSLVWGELKRLLRVAKAPACGARRGTGLWFHSTLIWLLCDAF